MSCEKIFLEKLRKRGFRLTPQREIVLSILHKIDSMASVEEIFEKVRDISTAIDISTVYRTLDLLQEFNLVISTDLGDGHHVYKLVGVENPHLHLICRQCGAVIGTEMGPNSSLAAYYLEHYGFRVDFDSLSFPGLCKNCQPQDS